MFKTTFISIRRFTYNLFIFFIISSCGPEPGEERQQTDPDKRTKPPTEKPAPEEKESIALTTETAGEFLSEYARNNSEDEAVIKTPLGDIRIRLYKNTSLHRANFIYLTRNEYYDDTWFYRVSKDHVIQAGNTDLQETVRKRMELGDYRVPSEIDAGNYHKRGAVAAVRSYFQNPEKDSDPYEFYIVIGKSYSRNQLERLAEKQDMSFSEEQLQFYTNNPGAPHLDGQHTVFGEVIEGMDVVRKINEVEVDEGEWPIVNIPIDVEVVD